MTVSPQLEAYHRHEAEVAAQTYVAGLTTPDAAIDWHAANTAARQAVISALRASANLTNTAAALTATGRHLLVFRHLFAPPLSQDQFKLLCPEYSKSSEKSGTALSPANADSVASVIYQRRNRQLTKWLNRGAPPTRRELRELLHSVSPMLSQQIVATVRRNRLSAAQEGAVIDLLKSKGWLALNSSLVQTLSDVPAKHFMHKTLFATKTLAQEVDVACGLGKTVVLAMECKVTNDQTNSVKRINDVLKKATAWQDHWGSFVRTAALLQGVIAYKDVHRLLVAGVEVFWSHKLDDFGTWIDSNSN